MRKTAVWTLDGAQIRSLRYIESTADQVSGNMRLEVARLLLGLVIAGFHARIADFIMEQERVLLLTLRRYGIEIPVLLSRRTAQNLYFSFGILIVLIQLLRLHQMAR